MERNYNNLYAVTVGFFDGVHAGHRYLVDELRGIAAERGLKSRIVTFTEHPRQVIQSDYKPLLLSSPEDKLRMLDNTGVDLCTALHFDIQMAMMDAETFMREVLYERLGARCLLMGHDHRFGHDNIPDFNIYRRIGESIGIEVIQANAFIWNGRPVSSSRIRTCLSSGEVADATKMLGYYYTLKGTVVHGLKNGRKMGFPTANLGPYCELMQIPANGVYAALASVQGETFKSMLNIGYRPTLNSDVNTRTIEAHLLDFNRDIYGEELSLSIVDYLRPERRFDSLQALSAQLAKDRDTIPQILSRQL